MEPDPEGRYRLPLSPSPSLPLHALRFNCLKVIPLTTTASSALSHRRTCGFGDHAARRARSLETDGDDKPRSHGNCQTWVLNRVGGSRKFRRVVA